MRAEEIKGLMEAYSKVNETPEVSEEVVEENVETFDEATGSGDPAADIINQRRAEVMKRLPAAKAKAQRDVVSSRERIAATGAAPRYGALPTDLKSTEAKAFAAAKKYEQQKASTGTGSGGGAGRGGSNQPGGGGGAPSGQVVTAAGGKGGKVTVGTKYAATLGGQKGSVTYDASGKKTFTADKPSTSSSTAAPKPAAQTGDKTKDMSTWAKANPTLANKPKTPNPLMQKTFGYQTGNAPDQIAKASQGVSKETSDKAFAKSKEMVKSFKPSADLKMDLDIFDLVKGHLLDEGYAETEQNAIVMMANMSEEWRKSILEAHGVQLDEVSYSAKDARAGEDIGKPGKEFEKISKEAGERYGSKERGEKVAGAVLAKLRAKKG